jgi:glutamate dehydrogenase/leucine dehydrogenase
MIVEGTNGPVTPIAGEMLRDKGVYIFPDLIFNAGGVIGAYFEWIKNLSHTTHGMLTKRWE